MVCFKVPLENCQRTCFELLKVRIPNRATGEIQIKLQRQEARNETNKWEISKKSTRYTLIASDDGVEILEEIDFENAETPGLKLVNTLVDQLDGETELKRDKRY